MLTTTISLERGLYMKLRHIALDEGTNARELIRQAVQEFLARREKKGGDRK